MYSKQPENSHYFKKNLDRGKAKPQSHSDIWKYSQHRNSSQKML